MLVGGETVGRDVCVGRSASMLMLYQFCSAVLISPMDVPFVCVAYIAVLQLHRCFLYSVWFICFDSMSYQWCLNICVFEESVRDFVHLPG